MSVTVKSGAIDPSGSCAEATVAVSTANAANNERRVFFIKTDLKIE
jgi:hypothetical protein